MLKSNLIELLSNLNAKEFKEFGEYIHSSFFNKNQSVIKLYNYISKYYPDFKSEALNKKLVYCELFPETEFNDGFMQTVIFNLSKLAEEYLSYKNYSVNSYGKKINLVNELYNRKIKKLFLKKAKEAEEELDKKYPDAAYFRNKYEIESIKAHFFTTILNYNSDYKKLIEFTETKYLINYFLTELLSDYRNYLNLSKVLNYKFDLRIFEFFLGFIREHGTLIENNLVWLHYYEAMLLKEPRAEYYFKLKDILIKEMNNFDQTTKYGTITILLNYTYFQYYSGGKKFLKERFELCKMRLEHNLYAKSAGGYLGENVYDVSLKTAILMGELKWAENFIRDYKELLQPEFRESISNYALAYLNFAKKNYENTLSLLAKATIPKNITLKNGVKILGLMIYYERNMLEAAFDGIDSYRHFLLNDKIMAEWRKQLHRNFLIYYNKLLKIKSGKNIKNLAQIKNELKHNYNIVEREWLITKASELEKKN